jgi:nudix motif 8
MEERFLIQYREHRKYTETERLVTNYTAPALAGALRDREETLRLASQLLNQGNMDDLRALLDPYRQFAGAAAEPNPAPATVVERLQLIRKVLQRVPRSVSRAAVSRASVIIPLCHVNGEPAVFLTKRSDNVGKHKREVCFPGGMVDEADSSILDTCLRELEEEVGIDPNKVDVLGILRCDWGEVEKITGISVTPVVGYIGEMSELQYSLNSEVDQCFTVTFNQLHQPENWVHRYRDGVECDTPVFSGGKHLVWGLTAYFLSHFMTVMNANIWKQTGVIPRHHHDSHYSQHLE